MTHCFLHIVSKEAVRKRLVGSESRKERKNARSIGVSEGTLMLFQGMPVFHALQQLLVIAEHTNAIHIVSRRDVIPLVEGAHTPLRQFHKCNWRRWRLASSARRSSERASCIILAAQRSKVILSPYKPRMATCLMSSEPCQISKVRSGAFTKSTTCFRA
jgi:hypothetical protein